MQHTNEENAKRKEIVETALRDAVDWLASNGYELTPEQGRQLQERMTVALAQLQATEPTESLDLLVVASMFQSVGELLGHLPPADPAVWMLELGTAGAEAARHLLAVGRYPVPTEDQLRQMTHTLRRRAEVLVGRGMAIAPEAARQDMRDTAASVVLVVMGDPPDRVGLN